MLFNREEVCRPLFGGGLMYGADTAALCLPTRGRPGLCPRLCWGQGVDKNKQNKHNTWWLGLGEGMSEDGDRLNASACSKSWQGVE